MFCDWERSPKLAQNDFPRGSNIAHFLKTDLRCQNLTSGEIEAWIVGCLEMGLDLASNPPEEKKSDF